jgi:hypothetical protein
LKDLGVDGKIIVKWILKIKMKMAVFWVVAPCNLVEGYRRLRGACCLHHQGDDDRGNVGNLLSGYTATTQKTDIFVGYELADWINLVQIRVQCRLIMNTTMHFRIP